MKYIDIQTVVNSYKGFQNSMTNKSWGYLALLKGCKSTIRPTGSYMVDMDIVSNFLEDIFNLSTTKRIYDGGRSLYVVFSNKWKDYFKEQGSYTPNIYDVASWAYRRKSFPDNVTREDIVKMFSSEFNISYEDIENSFDIKSKNIEFSNFLYSESELKVELGKIGVDISKNNIDAKKGGVVAAPGEISRGPFVQPLYAGLEITDYVIILQSDYLSLYNNKAVRTKEAETSLSLEKIPYITAIKSKPFLLLAGISGTGKSRIVRELARACWDDGSEEYEAQKPRNFEMVQVKPNWHDSSELIGYVSRVSGSPVFEAGDFLKFVAKAWENPEVPYFLCLDEMNLAPVEQYFAEYLSVVESRKTDGNGVITTDPILKKCDEQWYFDLTAKLTNNDEIRARFNKDGICIPQNLIVVGTVNMDETTFSFSRKVLDRAMTIEMNEVDLYGGLTDRHEKIGKLEAGNLIGTAVEGVDVYKNNKDVCEKVINCLKVINANLEGTPFKVAYRTRNEFLLYVVNNLPYNKEEDGSEISQKEIIARALDEITSMKILSRIEGDETKIGNLLEQLREIISGQLNTISDIEYSATKNEEGKAYSISLAKLKEMEKRLKTSGYTSFWS